MDTQNYVRKTRRCCLMLWADNYKTTHSPGSFSGYASVFDAVDTCNDRVVRGAFKDSLLTFQKLGRMPKMLWQHNVQDVIGIWHDLREDDHGLHVKGQILLDVQKGREAYSLMQAKAIDGLSIGFNIIESLKGSTKNVRLLTKINLIEISLVTLPANTQANVISVN